MKYLFVVMAGSIGVLPDNWTFVKRKPRLEEEAGGGARWSKEQGGREGAENGVDYQVWSSVQCPVVYSIVVYGSSYIYTVNPGN